MPSLLPTPEPADPVEGAPGHFEHTNWVKASLKALDAGLLRNNGDTSVGNITINKAGSEDSFLILVGNGIRGLWGYATSGLPRWRLSLGESTAESGVNSGSKFSLTSYADDGSMLHTVLSAERATGLLTVVGSPTAAKGVATKEYADAVIPLGTITAFGGSVAPTGWHLCDGSAHGSAALQTLIGSANTPDLRGRFLLGASTTYPAKATGGAATVTLTAAQSGTAAHGHGASMGVEDTDHTHSINPPNTLSGYETATHYHSIDPPNTNTTTDTHSHTLSIREGTGENDGYFLDTNPTDSGVNKTLSGSKTSDDAHYHAVNISAFNSGADVGSHQHNVDIAAFNSGGIQGTGHRHALTIDTATAAPASAAHENMPPYFALTYIIKKV